MARTVGILGASGFAGGELLRLVAGHPDLELAWAAGETAAGKPVAALHPGLAAVVGELRFTSYDPAAADGLDLVFLALPHGASAPLMADLRKRAGVVVDLAADFRLKDPDLYPTWYGEAHTCPERLADFAYGLPELFRSDILTSSLIAAPGCYVTAAALALTPLVRAGLVGTTGIVVDAASGVSGAGRPAKPNTTFCTVDEDFSTYGVLTHRHTPEMEQVIGAQLVFTPHLAPMNRGILATCYARPVDASLTTADAHDVVRAAYADEPFVVQREGSLSTKATQGSNTAHVSVVVDPRTGWLIACAALDNLVKGAAGQAVQCANLLLGLPETTGLATAGLYP
jgi:N-acetyl-gamma-glutamyl-phosphate reductase